MTMKMTMTMTKSEEQVGRTRQVEASESQLAAAASYRHHWDRVAPSTRDKYQL